MEHITQYRDEGRVEIWRRLIGDLTRWMSSTMIDTPLIDMVEEYLLAQGRKTMAECVQVSTPSYQVLADVHDRLG